MTSGERAGRGATSRGRHDGWTAGRRRLFIDALGTCGNVRDACRAAGISNTSAYRLRRCDAGFGAEWDAALARAAVSLEALAFERATVGAEEVVIRDGIEVARKRRPSDTIFRLILQASNPQKYGRTGNQSAVAMREALEDRVHEIEMRAYRAAWAAFAAEYRYHLEPHYVRERFRRKLQQMHGRMCTNPYCAECFPDRKWKAFDNREDTTPPADHHPVVAPGDLEMPRLTAPKPAAEPIDLHALRMELADKCDARRRAHDPNAPLRDRTIKPLAPEMLRWSAEAAKALAIEHAAARQAGGEIEVGPGDPGSSREVPIPPIEKYIDRGGEEPRAPRYDDATAARMRDYLKR